MQNRRIIPIKMAVSMLNSTVSARVVSGRQSFHSDKHQTCRPDFCWHVMTSLWGEWNLWLNLPIFGPFLFQHYRLHTFCFYAPKGLSRSLFSFMLWFDSKANKDSIWSDGSHLLEQCCVRTKHSFTLLLLLEKCQGRESQGTLFCAECTYFADFQFSFKVHRLWHLIKSINLHFKYVSKFTNTLQ